MKKLFICIFLLFTGSQACNLSKVELKNSTKGISIHINFKGLQGHLVYDAEITSQDDMHLLTYSIADCESSVRKLPVMEFPILHTEVIESDETLDGKLNLVFYLKIEPSLSHKDGQNSIITSIPVNESFPDAAPKVLDKITYQSDATNTVTMKFAFDDIPTNRHGFMSVDKKKAIFIFDNTATASKPVKPDVNFVSGFKVEDGVSFAGLPFTKITFESRDQMFYTDSPEGSEFLVELYGQSEVEEEQGIQAATTYTPTEGSSGIDLAEYEREQSSYQSGAIIKGILVYGLGGALVLGGGYYAWEKLKEGEEDGPDKGDESVPGPEKNTIFPTE